MFPIGDSVRLAQSLSVSNEVAAERGGAVSSPPLQQGRHAGDDRCGVIAGIREARGDTALSWAAPLAGEVHGVAQGGETVRQVPLPATTAVTGCTRGLRLAWCRCW